MRILPPAVACLLAGCSGLTATDPGARPVLPAPSLTQPCAGPVALPDRALPDQEVEILWGRDRATIRCWQGRHAGLVDFVTPTERTN